MSVRSMPATQNYRENFEKLTEPGTKEELVKVTIEFNGHKYAGLGATPEEAEAAAKQVLLEEYQVPAELVEGAGE